MQKRTNQSDFIYLFTLSIYLFTLSIHTVISLSIHTIYLFTQWYHVQWNYYCYTFHHEFQSNLTGRICNSSAIPLSSPCPSQKIQGLWLFESSECWPLIGHDRQVFFLELPYTAWVQKMKLKCPKGLKVEV